MIGTGRGKCVTQCDAGLPARIVHGNFLYIADTSPGSNIYSDIRMQFSLFLSSFPFALKLYPHLFFCYLFLAWMAGKWDIAPRWNRIFGSLQADGSVWTFKCSNGMFTPSDDMRAICKQATPFIRNAYLPTNGQRKSITPVGINPSETNFRYRWLVDWLSGCKYGFIPYLQNTWTLHVLTIVTF